MPRPRLLLVGPLPPPYGGVPLMVQMQRFSPLAQEFCVEALDTSKKRLRVTVEHPTLRAPLYFLRDLPRLAWRLATRRPDVVLVHAVANLSLVRDWVFMLAARLAGARVVCHFHATLQSSFPPFGSRFGRLLGRFLMAPANRVVVLSPRCQREMGRAWQRDDLAWAPSTAEVELYAQRPAARPGWLAPGERAVLFVGRLSAPKGIHDLFDAIPRVLARHPEARFALVGVAESEAQEPVLRAEVERRGIGPRVTFLGPLDGGDKVAAFAAADMIVVPSWTEGFPLVIPEAMAAGLPIVASAVGTIPEFVEDGRDGFLISPRAPAELAAAVCRLLDDELLRRRISRRVRQRAPREFSVAVGAARVAQAVREALGEPPPRLAPSKS